jgi:hypothetical protein
MPADVEFLAGFSPDEDPVDGEGDESGIRPWTEISF